MRTIKELKKQINSASKRGIPFLFAINYEMTEGFVIERPLEQTEVFWRVGRYSNFDSVSMKPAVSGTYFSPRPIGYDHYVKKFDFVKQQLMFGNSFLANLTIKTPVETDYTMQEIIARSNSPYALLIPGKFACFSPETFVKISNRRISSFPMKGTIKITENITPEVARETILNDYKESAEHYTIVDLIRSDLSRVATKIKVEKLRYIDKLETSKGSILQVSSEVCGELLEGYRDCLGDTIFELLPAGSISGAPKHPTLEMLEKAEGEERGYYTGVFGYFDGEELDSAVMIRYIEQVDGEVFFRSGGGITINSQCEQEYNEMLEKIYLPFDL